MKRKSGLKQFGIVLLAAFYLTGCGKEAASSQIQASVQTEETKTEMSVQAEEDEAAVQTDRYQEIVDRSQDKGKLTVYFLDLKTNPDAEDKAGDSTILISPDGKVMLLDAGHPDAGHLVVQALKDLGVETIDYLVASHPHIDHIGGIPEVMEAFPVGETYRSCVEYTTKTYDNYVAALEKAAQKLIF